MEDEVKALSKIKKDASKEKICWLQETNSHLTKQATHLQGLVHQICVEVAPLQEENNMLFDEYQDLKEDHDSLLLHLTKKDEIIQGLLGSRCKLEAEVYQLENVGKTIVVKLLGSPTDIDCNPSICKKVDVSILSYVLFSTYDVVSPNFEKRITRTGSQLLRNMGYTRGRLRKNRHDIVVPIAPKMYISREGLGYDVLVSSLSSSGIAKSRKFVFVGGGVQTKLLEQQTSTKCVEHIHIVAMLELETYIVDGIFDNVEGFTHVTTLCLVLTSSILLEQI